LKQQPKGRVECKGYAQIKIDQFPEEQFLTTSADALLDFIAMCCDYGFKFSVEPVDSGFKTTVYGVATDGGQADGVAVTGGGNSVTIAVFMAMLKMMACEWSPETFLNQTNGTSPRFW